MPGFPSNEGVKEGYPPRRYFAVIGFYSVKTVADRHVLLIITSNSDKLFIGVNVDDLEWFWTTPPKKMVL